jgi:MFS family permease
MTINPIPNKVLHTPIIIWLIGVSFVLFQFFLQMSSGIVIGSIMHNMNLTALMAGALSGSFYIIYTGLQVPVGILFDRKSTPMLLSVNALICSFGCLFAASHGLIGFFLGRLLIGTGSAFAFIGLSHLLTQHYPAKQFAFMIGLSETLGFIATVVGMVMMGTLIAKCGWRSFINGAGVTGLFIAYFSWKKIPNHQTTQKPKEHYGKQLIQILINKTAWINGLFVGLTFVIVTAFGALWAAPFLQVKLSCGLQQASLINAVFFFGTALSCPLFGVLSNKFSKRKPLILSSCLSTLVFLLILLYFPTQNYSVVSFLMFMIGLCCGAYMLAYSLSNEIAPKGSTATCTGFTNMLAVLTTPLIQPLIGYLLDLSNHSGSYTLINYQIALLTLPICLIIASILVCFLPEKNHSPPLH